MKLAKNTGEENKSVKISTKRRIALFLGVAIYYFLFCILILWAAGVLYYDVNWNSKMQALPAILWILFAIAATVLTRPHRLGIFTVLSFVTLIMIWHISILPQQYRDWQEVHLKTPYAEINGDIVTVHDIRDFQFRGPSDFTPAYETHSYNLNNLRDVDLFLNFWGSDKMAHPIVSFDFGQDGHLCFSIETRREKNEGFSAVGGLFKMFEIIYIACTERDCVMLRAVSPGEDVYLYKTKIGKEDTKMIFLQYIKRIDELCKKPEFYNAITANCTTSIRRQNSPERRRPWDWRMLINGEFDRMLYDNDMLDTSIPFEELKKRSHINRKALDAGYSSDFSERIRED